MNEKVLAGIGTLGVILFGVFASLVAWFAGGKDLQSNNRNIIRQMFNWELNLLIACIVLGLIPIVGILVGLAGTVANIIFAVKAYNASVKGADFKAPGFEFIK